MDSILFYFLFYTNYFLENDLVEKLYYFPTMSYFTYQTYHTVYLFGIFKRAAKYTATVNFVRI